MSTLVTKNLQIGADGTASNNFTVYQPVSPDGTLRIGNGNSGTTSAQVVLTSAGNVGIGTSSPSANLQVNRSAQQTNIDNAAQVASFLNTSTDTAGNLTGFRFRQDNGTNAAQGFFGLSSTGNAATRASLIFAPPNTSGNATERMRIDSSGNLLLGATALGVNANYFGLSPGNAFQDIGHVTGVASGIPYIRFLFAGGVIGNITQSGTTAVLYNTTSDYRLKTVIGPVANSGQRIDALQPVEYTWNASGESTRGFLAHQFQEVYEGSVSGTKDAVDAEGKPVYQAMQVSTSEVIADLVAEIQSLRARVTALESN